MFFESEELAMAVLTIRNLEDEVKERLRVRAARAGHSMEEEVRTILRSAVGGVTGPELLKLSRELFGEKHGVDMELPSRDDPRVQPHFD